MYHSFQLCFQFQETAPTGVLSKQSFIETFETMVGVAFGMEQLPDHWMNINPVQVRNSVIQYRCSCIPVIALFENT